MATASRRARAARGASPNAQLRRRLADNRWQVSLCLVRLIRHLLLRFRWQLALAARSRPDPISPGLGGSGHTGFSSRLSLAELGPGRKLRVVLPGCRYWPNPLENRAR